MYNLFTCVVIAVAIYLVSKMVASVVASKQVNVVNHTRSIIHKIHKLDLNWFDNRPFSAMHIKDSNIELEFSLIPAYRHAFKKFNVVLEESNPDHRANGYSHQLRYKGNTIGVKNYVVLPKESGKPTWMKFKRF